MKKIIIISFCVITFLSLGSLSNIFPQSTPPSVAEEIIAITYKLWKAENQKDMAIRNKYVADDYTEFNGSYSTRIDGKTKNFKLSDANFSGGTSLADEMLNPKVQVYGDTAILTYNFAGVTKNGDGKVSGVKAKSTRVYVKMNNNWKLVHANFGWDPTED
jgi:ketosteroid isomerase-like protein